MPKIRAFLAAGLLAATLVGCASTARALLPESRAELHHPPHVSAWTRFWAGMLLSGHSQWRDSDGTWHKYPTGCMWTTSCPAVLMRSVPHSATAPPRETPGRTGSGRMIARPAGKERSSPSSQPECRSSAARPCTRAPESGVRPAGPASAAGGSFESASTAEAAAPADPLRDGVEFRTADAVSTAHGRG